MPELPEVEVTRRTLAPHVTGRLIVGCRTGLALRHPFPETEKLAGHTVLDLERRGKYLIAHLDGGQNLIFHLGMSGSLRLAAPEAPFHPHEHFELAFADASCLRLRDPRRFGAVIRCQGDVFRHSLLCRMGPEPFSDAFSAASLKRAFQDRRAPVKTLLLDQTLIAGIGNIYACEALFAAGIHPQTPAGELASSALERLVGAIQTTLARAIEAGGSSLRDFVDADGHAGYFQQTLHVYGRAGQACPNCSTPVASLRLGGRNTFFCPSCQRV